MSRLMRVVYVSLLRYFRSLSAPLGLLSFLERHSGRRARWLRSLFAIYDLDDLVRLDLPWWTFEAIDAVEAHLASRPGARVFEWGSGASTVWLSRRAGQVLSIEHDANWAGRVRARLDRVSHAEVRTILPQRQGRIGSQKAGYKDLFFDRYVEAIREVEGLFDLIVIDGRAREACLIEAKARLTPGGVILIDDFKRSRYRTAALSSGLTIRQFCGLAVCLPLPDSTALLSWD